MKIHLQRAAQYPIRGGELENWFQFPVKLTTLEGKYWSGSRDVHIPAALR